MRGRISTGRFRNRLTIAFVLVAAVAGGTVATAAYLMVRDERRDTFKGNSLRVARLVSSFADDLLTGSPQPDEVRRLLARFDRINEFDPKNVDVVVVADGIAYSSDPTIELDRVPRELRIDRGLQEIDTAGTTISGDPFLVAASSLADSPVDLYLFFSEEDLASDFSDLRVILLGDWLALTLVSALVGWMLARRTLRPVARASAAARSIAEGFLRTRLPVESRDEFGAWAASFNGMAEELERKITALSEAHSREKRFTQDVSHELRTPLTALLSASSMLEEQLDALPEDARWTAQRMIVETRRLRSLVEELLEISRLDSGREPVVHELVRLDEVAGRLLGARGWTNVRVEGKDVAVETDKRRVERILDNLIGNALTHGATEVEVRLDHHDGTAMVSVIDDGPGIPARDLPHIFDRFYKADPARAGGTGLGLAIAIRNATLLGGDIEVESTPGSGSRFVFRVPCAPPA